MNKLILIMSILCFIPNLFWLLAEITGTRNFIIMLIIKAIALLGTILPVIYWLKITNII
jgi:hypothetical protein